MVTIPTQPAVMSTSDVKKFVDLFILIYRANVLFARKVALSCQTHDRFVAQTKNTKALKSNNSVYKGIKSPYLTIYL